MHTKKDHSIVCHQVKRTQILTCVFVLVETQQFEMADFTWTEIYIHEIPRFAVLKSTLLNVCKRIEKEEKIFTDAQMRIMRSKAL